MRRINERCSRRQLGGSGINSSYTFFYSDAFLSGWPSDTIGLAPRISALPRYVRVKICRDK